MPKKDESNSKSIVDRSSDGERQYDEKAKDDLADRSLDGERQCDEKPTDALADRSPDGERQYDEKPKDDLPGGALAETVSIDEINSSPFVDDAISKNVETTDEILLDGDTNSIAILNAKHSDESHADRRSSYQSSLADIVEVESLASNDGEAVNNTEIGVQMESLAEGNLEDAKNNCLSDERESEGKNKGAVEQSDAIIAIRQDGTKTELDQVRVVKSNRSFEERMSRLHEKMENQLLDKLQHLEEKISHAQQQKVDASAEETMKLKKELSESTTTIMQLNTEIASKDLEMLKLKQQIIHLETSLEESLVKPATSDAHVGDGELNPDNPTICGDDILGEKAVVEQELSNAKMQTEQTSKLLAEAEHQLKETARRLQAAEQEIEEEKASSASMMALLEQKGKDDERVDKALLDKIAAEKERSEASLSKLREDIVREKDTARNEIASIQKEKSDLEDKLATEKTRIGSLEEQLAGEIASQRSSLMELKIQHDKELNELRSKHNEELHALQGRLKEEQIARTELEIRSNEATDAMERAVEKQIAAEKKLKEMKDMINETENLRTVNDRLHTSLQNETEKRKVLHNQIEDMKGGLHHPLLLLNSDSFLTFLHP